MGKIFPSFLVWAHGVDHVVIVCSWWMIEIYTEWLVSLSTSYVTDSQSSLPKHNVWRSWLTALACLSLSTCLSSSTAEFHNSIWFPERFQCTCCLLLEFRWCYYTSWDLGWWSVNFNHFTTFHCLLSWLTMGHTNLSMNYFILFKINLHYLLI